MRTFEQLLKNKNRGYYHGSPFRLSYIKGENLGDFTVGFLTTNKMYASKYALDQKENSDNSPGYIYRVKFKTIPNIFEPNNPNDLYRWKQHYSVSDNWNDLEILKNTDWLQATRFAFGKDRTETMVCLFRIGFDGFSCNERRTSNDNFHSIGVFNPEEKLDIVEEINLDLYKSNIDANKEESLNIFFESRKVALDLFLDKIQEAKSDSIPNRWLDYRVLNSCYYDKIFEETLRLRGFLN